MASFIVDLEEGDLTDFDSTVTDGGDLSAHADAANEGSYGLKAVIDDTNAIYGKKEFDNKSRLRAGFYFDPNGLAMDPGDTFRILVDGTSSDYYLMLSEASPYELTLSVRLDDDSWSTTAAVAVSDASHWIEIDCYISSGANDGFCKLWVDSDVTGAPDAQNTGLNNDTKDFDDLRVGAVVGLDVSTFGTIYFDYICANDDGASIGPPAAPAGQPMNLRATTVPHMRQWQPGVTR